MTHPLSDALLYVLTSFCLTIGALTSIITAYRVLIALRAKHRAHEMLVVAAANDVELKHLFVAAQKEALTDLEVKNAIDKIGRIILKLSSEDQKFLEDAMHQRSPSGTKRFVKSVLLAA